MCSFLIIVLVFKTSAKKHSKYGFDENVSVTIVFMLQINIKSLYW